MSNFNLPDFIIQTFTKGLETYANILSKTQEYAKANNIDVNTFVQARLVEDQLPLAFQVQNTSKAVLANLGRLGGPEPTVFENNETTFEDLQKRIAKTLEFVKSFDAEAVKGKEDEEIEATFGGSTFNISRRDLVLNTGLPNFFFHLTTGYAILRTKGVPLGKVDYLSGFFAL